MGRMVTTNNKEKLCKVYVYFFNMMQLFYHSQFYELEAFEYQKSNFWTKFCLLVSAKSIPGKIQK